MSIRCAPTHVAALKKLNAKPVVIPPTEVYTALERGVCQGLVWPAGLIRDWGWDKVVRYAVEPGFYQGAMLILLNLDTWKKLPPNIQKILLESEDQAEHLAAERAAKTTKEAAEAMAKEGMKTIKLPDAEAKKLVDTAYSTLWEVVIGKSPEYRPKLREIGLEINCVQRNPTPSEFRPTGQALGIVPRSVSCARYSELHSELHLVSDLKFPLSLPSPARGEGFCSISLL